MRCLIRFLARVRLANVRSRIASRQDAVDCDDELVRHLRRRITMNRKVLSDLDSERISLESQLKTGSNSQPITGVQP